MKKILTKICILLMAAVMALGFASCGIGGKEVDPINRDKELSLSVFHWAFTGFANSYKESSVAQALMDELKISDFEVYTAPYSDWQTSFGLLASTGELPDFFKFNGPDSLEQYTQWVEDEMLLNVTEWVTKEEYPNLYEHLHSYDNLNLGRVTGGGLYAIPVRSGQPNHVMVIRGDWVDNLNAKRSEIANVKYISGSDYTLGDEEYKYPETITEFYRLAVAMTYADPDNNGSNDTYGYTSSSTDMWYNHWIFNMFGSSYQDYMLNEDGEYESTWINDGSKNAVKFIKKMRDEGIIEPNFFANDPIGGMNQFFQGKIGMTLINGDWYNGELAKMQDAFRDQIEAGDVDPDRLMDMVLPLPAGDGNFDSVPGARGFKGNYGYAWFCGINNDISDNKKDRICMLLDYMLSDEGEALTLYGVEGEHYEKDADGNIVNLIPDDDNGNPRTLKTWDYGWEIRQMIDQSTQYFMPWEDNYELLDEMTDYVNGPDGGKIYAPTGVAGETRTNYEKALFDQSIEWYAKLIYGQTIDGGTMNNFDDAWNEFVEAFLDNKGREILFEINEIVKGQS